MRKIIFASIIAATALSSVPAFANYSDYLKATCGQNCTNPTLEESSAKSSWDSLKKLGTTAFNGASVNGVTIDASGLLAAARQVGSVELDRWLQGGGASSASVVDSIMTAFTTKSGFDVSRITGITTGGSSFSSLNKNLEGLSGMAGIASVSQVSSVGLGGGTGYCDPVVDSAINASAQQKVNDAVSVALSDDYGFSKVGGLGAGSSTNSSSGIFGGSCLDLFMTGDFDTLFRPPQLSQLVSKMTEMFGGSGGGAGANCMGAPSIADQVNGSMNNAIFTPGNGGFFPALEMGASETAGSGLSFSNNYGINPDTFKGTSSAESQIGKMFRM